MRSITLLLATVLASCSAAPAHQPEPMPEPPPQIVPPPDPPVAVVLPKQLRAALSKAIPKERLLAASPASNSDEIRLVRLLHHNVVKALDEIERDGGRHITPQLIARARTAVTDLQNHLNEFAAAHGGLVSIPY